MNIIKQQDANALLPTIAAMWLYDCALRNDINDCGLFPVGTSSRSVALLFLATIVNKAPELLGEMPARHVAAMMLENEMTNQ